jgi:phosphate transport system permease protein
MTPDATQSVQAVPLKGSGGFSKARRLWSGAMDTIEPGVEWLIRICGWSAIFFVLAIFAFVFVEGAPVLGHLDLKEFFTSPNWRPTSQVKEQYGILALVAGTLSVTVVAMLIAVPFGLGAAVFISEFSTGKTKETLKIVIEMLAAIPSVVWGFIGYMVMGPLIIKMTGAPVGVNVLNGGIILALMSVPVIVSVSEDALRAVPDSYREAAQALGASKWEIVCRVLFPAAKSGLLAAVLLGVGRSFGETMAVLMATGHAVQIPHSALDPVRTLTATIAAELGEAVRGDDHYRVLFLIGIVLFAFVFVVNVTADLIVKGIKGRQHD